ncbi:OLV11-like tyrosine recombinase [Chrysochromulina parva virophage Moe]|nr:OLV11-like tyrosine recombinase [Chrysochromulina parva virophage Moe]
MTELEKTELERFRETFANKSKITNNVYNSNYKKLRDLLGDVDIASVSQKKVIEIAEGFDNRNTQQSLINIAFLIRKEKGMAINELEIFRKKNQTFLKDKIYEANTALVDSLPSYDELVNFIDGLVKDQKYTQYVINYLLLHCQVRNADLNFDFVQYKRDTKDESKNYLWFSAKTKTAHYIRNVYKTAKIVKPNGEITGYGQKIIKITDPVFIKVMKILVNYEKKENKPIVFIPNLETLAYHIKKMTYKNLGETMYFKIVVNKFRSDPNMLKQISDNRGTDINTIFENYDIESKPIN